MKYKLLIISLLLGFSWSSTTALVAKDTVTFVVTSNVRAEFNLCG